MLRNLGVQDVHLMTNNPLKVNDLRSAGMSVSQRVSHLPPMPELAAAYVAVKRDRMGHLVSVPPVEASDAPARKVG